MRVITLTQPWATLIALGEKRVETRNRRISGTYTGELLAIHAGKTVPAGLGGERGLRQRCGTPPFVDALSSICTNEDVAKYGRRQAIAQALPRGAVVAYGTVVGCVPTENAEPIIRSHPRDFPEWELEFGDYSPGRYAWILNEIHALSEPWLGHRGNQAFGTLPAPVAREIIARGEPVPQRPRPVRSLVK